ncbi:MAG TPA: hypothetical protein VN643_23310, partial [Pyrinomonadaceae bacterium]|nr:hypothetical protein [Pyrinomonadaceae bacterium]
MDNARVLRQRPAFIRNCFGSKKSQGARFEAGALSFYRWFSRLGTGRGALAFEDLDIAKVSELGRLISEDR